MRRFLVLTAAAMTTVTMGVEGVVAGAKPDPRTPMPGRAVIPANFMPDGCGKADLPSTTARHMYDDVKALYNEFPDWKQEKTRFNGGIPWNAKNLRKIGQAACMNADDAEALKDISRLFQGWVNVIGLSADELKKHMAIRLSPQFDEQKESFCSALKGEVDDTANAEEKARNIAYRQATGCIGDDPVATYITDDIGIGDGRDLLGWFLDRGAEVDSEVLRAVMVNRCLRPHSLVEDDDFPDSKHVLVLSGAIMCGQDVARLDRAKLEKELADPKYNDYARMNAREAFLMAKTMGELLISEHKKLAARDPAYQALLFDAPAKGWKEWEAGYAANKPAWDAAIAYEKKIFGTSQKALQGCGPALREGFAGYIRSKKPKTVDEAQKAARDVIGYFLLEKLMHCDAVEGRKELAWAENRLLHPNDFSLIAPIPPRRGPRFAAYAAAIAALGDIAEDNKRFAIKDLDARFEQPDPQRWIEADAGPRYGTGIAQYIPRFAGGMSFQPDPNAEIASLKKSGDRTHVTFKKTSVKILNRVCVPNKRIVAIEGGVIKYDHDCTIHSPKWLEKDTTLFPVEVPELLMGGIKVGDRVTFVCNSQAEPCDAVPVEVFDASGEKLVNFMGISLR